MGSGSKKHKDKESRKRRHHSPTVAYEGDEQQYEAPKEKKHRHKKHHKEKKQREKAPATSSSSVSNRHEYENYDSDCVEVAVDEAPLPPPPPPQVHQQPPERSSERSHHHHHHHHHQARSRQQQQQEPEPSSSSSSSQHHQQHHHQNVESLSIEETNKLRAKLGLKPLDVSSSNSKSSSSESSDRRRGGTDDSANQKRKDDWGEFYHKPAENWAEKSQQEKLREKLATRKEKRHLETKLSKVRTLGESDSDEDDNDKIEKADSWVDRSRKIELAKREAEKRAKMLEELDEQFGLGEIVESEAREKRRHQYTERHLKGLKVQHDVDSFAEERDVILTLKDSGVLDVEDDVLINVNMLDDERYKRNVENKKKKLVYNAYEDQEFDEYGNPKEKSLLAQYDEEIEGPSSNKDGFKIGYDNAQERKQMVVQNIKEKLAKKRLETIETKDLQLASEYYNEEEMTKFKKPKKKAARKMRSKGKLLTADDLEQAVNNKGIEAVGSRRPKIRLEDYDIDDVPDMDVPTDDIKLEDDKDDVLEKALHRTRKIKQKESVIADIIKQTPIKSEEEEEGGNESSELPFDSSNIVLNATAEFCRTLGDIPTYGKSGNREESAELIDFDRDMKDHDSDGDGGGMGFDENVHLMANGLNDDEDQEKTGWNSVDPNENKKVVPQVVPQEVQILDEEPDVSTGMGAALKLAMSKGYLDKEQNKRPSNSRLAHLQAKHYSIEDKTYGEEGDRSSRRERYSGPVSDFKEKDSFKPNVKLEYIDDDGHVLSSKEAFRYLSHKFHGKGPGKNKIEKRLKKSVQEQLMKKMSSTDTPLGTLNMLQAKQKETQSPFVVLSGSNKSQATVISKTSSSSGRR